MCAFVYHYVAFFNCLLNVFLIEICGVFVQAGYVIFLYEGINFLF